MVAGSRNLQTRREPRNAVSPPVALPLKAAPKAPLEAAREALRQVPHQAVAAVVPRVLLPRPDPGVLDEVKPDRQSEPAPAQAPDVSRAQLPPRPIKRPATPPPVMQLVVSLKKQNLTIYKNDKVVGRSRISSGKIGHRTPKGIFSIIQKRRFHRSNIYSGAPMPFMQRLTWSGIALHLGQVPGYPASHGCIRLPSAFAAQLFRSTQMRTHVVIADGSPAPQVLLHPNLPGRSNLAEQVLAVIPEAEPLVEPPSVSSRVGSLFVSANWFEAKAAEVAPTYKARQHDGERDATAP